MSKQEADVYIHCINIPRQTPTKISVHTKINRSTIYKLISTLKEKGFLYERVIKSKNLIYANSPHKALNFIKDTKQLQLNKLEKLIPSIENEISKNIGKSYNDTQTNVSIFTGQAGIAEAIRTKIDLNNDIYWLGPSKVFFKMLSEKDMFQNFSAKRMDTTSLSRAMSDEDFKSNTLFSTGPKSFRQLKVLEFPESITTMVGVSGNTIILIKTSGSKPEAVVIQESTYAEILRFALSLVWNSVK